MPIERGADAQAIWGALQPQDQALLTQLAQAAADLNLALVGGAIRDALLQHTPLDLDVVVEGPVRPLADASGLRYSYHPKYDNATLHLPDGRPLDLIRARGETYASPGAPPDPYPADLPTDLTRRDFSVNAVALNLHDHALIDPHDGQRDLARRELRPLHPHSFKEDPSRLARAARLAARLNFTLHPDGAAQIPEALRYAPQTPRLRGELPLTFSEPQPGRVLDQLNAWGAGELFGSDASAALLRLDRSREQGVQVSPATYAAAWLAAQPDPAQASHAHALGEKPLRLLERARSDARFPPGAPESILRRALGLPSASEGLSGADVIAMGVPAGPRVGRALAHLAHLRRAGIIHSPQDEREALRAYLESHGEA